MTDQEFVDNRKEIFKRPKTKKEIIGDKNIIYVDNFYDIIEAHESRKANEVVVIGPDVHMTPVDEFGKPKYYSAQNFSKRGSFVMLNTFQNCKSKEAQEARLIRERRSPLKARIEACDRYKNRRNERYVGMVWFDPNQTAHIVHPSTIIEGHRLHMFGIKQGSIEYKTVTKKSYSARKSHQRTVNVLVPSRSKGGKESVPLDHMCDLNDPQRFVEWTYFNTRHY